MVDILNGNFKLSDEQAARIASIVKNTLGKEQSDKVEKLFSDRNKMNAIASSMSERELAAVKEILNSPELLKRILTSPKAAEGLRKIVGEKNG